MVPGPRCWAAIPAAGTGVRMGGALPKQYLRLAGRSVIEHTLSRFIDHPRVAGVVVALAPGDDHWPQLPAAIRERVRTVEGGAERALSVRNCLQLLAGEAGTDDRVLVHDAARPCVRRTDIDQLLDAGLSLADGALLAQPVRDTMKRADAGDVVMETVERTGLWHALTPQLFPLAILMDAMDAALGRGEHVTDESGAMEALGRRPLLVRGRPDNIKITHADDLPLAAMFLSRQEEEGCA